MPRMGWTPSIVPDGPDQNYYIVVNDYGKLGIAFAETDIAGADLETTINDLMTGQHHNPVRVVAFNTAEHWSEDASEDIAREIKLRLDIAGQEMPSSIEAFVERHLGSERNVLATPGPNLQPDIADDDRPDRSPSNPKKGWRVKARGADGQTLTVTRNTIAGVTENYLRLRALGFNVWIEDARGKEISASEFGIGV